MITRFLIRCGHICHCSAKCVQNPVILIRICAIGSFMWGDKTSKHKFCSFSCWSHEFDTLSNKNLLGLEGTSVWVVLLTSLHYWKETMDLFTLYLYLYLYLFKNGIFNSNFTLVAVHIGCIFVIDNIKVLASQGVFLIVYLFWTWNCVKNALLMAFRHSNTLMQWPNLHVCGPLTV